MVTAQAGRQPVLKFLYAMGRPESSPVSYFELDLLRTTTTSKGRAHRRLPLHTHSAAGDCCSGLAKTPGHRPVDTEAGSDSWPRNVGVADLTFGYATRHKRGGRIRDHRGVRHRRSDTSDSCCFWIKESYHDTLRRWRNPHDLGGGYIAARWCHNTATVQPLLTWQCVASTSNGTIQSKEGLAVGLAPFLCAKLLFCAPLNNAGPTDHELARHHIPHRQKPKLTQPHAGQRFQLIAVSKVAAGTPAWRLFLRRRAPVVLAENACKRAEGKLARLFKKTTVMTVVGLHLIGPLQK